MKVEAWLTVKGTPKRYGQTMYQSGPHKGQTIIESAKVVKVSQNKPVLEGDSIAFKVEVDIDESWFLQGTATIKATIPAAPAASAEIQAQVDMPVKGRAKSAAAGVIQP